MQILILTGKFFCFFSPDFRLSGPETNDTDMLVVFNYCNYYYCNGLNLFSRTLHAFSLNRTIILTSKNKTKHTF